VIVLIDHDIHRSPRLLLDAMVDGAVIGVVV